jgi:chromosome partitioning protein
MSQHITSSFIKKIFMFEERKKNIQSIYNAEEKKEIPLAKRVARGRVDVRHWEMKDVPLIGKKFGFLSSPKKQQVLCKYIQKGGVLKT